MKKNVMMRLASFLLVAVLISTSAISGTYAKYVTSGTATDSARVAKWGVNFDIEGGPLFSKEYATTDTANFSNMQYSVKSSGNDNVVAPGTAGKAVTFRITGTPEVSYKVKFDFAATSESVFLKKAITYQANGVPGTEWTDITTAYEPVAYTYTLGGQTQKTANLTTMMADINAYEIYFDVSENKYYERTSSSANWTETKSTNLVIDWAWAFESGNDTYDTILGDIAAGVLDVTSLTDGTDYNTDINLTLTATATQID